MNGLTYLCADCETALISSRSPSHRELSQALESQIDKILELAPSPNEAFYRLYLLFKEHSAKMSLAFLCRQLNLSSKGSLGLAMKNKRGVSQETARGVPIIFHLNANQREKWLQLFEKEKRRWSVDLLRRELEKKNISKRDDDFSEGEFQHDLVT